MHLEGRLKIQCNNCDRKYNINLDDLWEEDFDNGERNMGSETGHSYSIEADCKCGNRFYADVVGVEYPPGAIEYQYHEMKGCTILEEPEIVMDFEDCGLPEPILSAYEQVLYDPQAMYSLEPWEFEEFVADVFRRQGFNLNVTQKTRDGGKDIVAEFEMGGVLYNTYFECKKYSPKNPVGVKIVRELFAVMERDRIDKGIIVTSSYFTADAKNEAKRLGIGLIDHNKLIELMHKRR